MILVDTNLLVRMTNSRHPHCALARRTLQALTAKGERLLIVPQNLYEFWAVATRPRGAPPAGQNGLDMSTERASLWLRYFQRRFHLLRDPEELVDCWHELVRTRSVRGIRAHDARLVAAMQTHGIARVLTFNADDFRGLGVTVLDPATVGA